jgi:hypothetical protein
VYGPVALFLEVIMLAIILLLIGLAVLAVLVVGCHNEDDHGIDHLDDDSQVICFCNCIGCFNEVAVLVVTMLPVA